VSGLSAEQTTRSPRTAQRLLRSVRGGGRGPRLPHSATRPTHTGPVALRLRLATDLPLSWRSIVYPLLDRPFGVGRRIEEIDLSRGAAIAALVRGDKVIMAHHDTVVLAEDHLIVFVTDKKLLPKVEKLFEVSVGFV